MTAFARLIDGAWAELIGPFTVGIDDDAIQYPANWPELATPQERAAVGIAEVVETERPAGDAMVIGSDLGSGPAPVRAWIVQEPALDDLKAIYKARADAIRDASINGGCATPLGRVDTTQESRIFIGGAIQMAGLVGPTFKIDKFRMEDNSYVVLDAAGTVALGLAMGRHVATCGAASFAIKDAIDAASTAAEVRAVDLTAGYPT